jgi:Cu2+-exporting ATPase
MILSSVVIAGAATAGTLGASLKAYREKKRKKEYPWTVAAERMAKKELAMRKGRHRKRSLFRGGSGEGIVGRVSENISRVHASSQAFRQEIMAPFVSDTRQQQMQEITVSDSVQEMQEEETAKRNLIVSSVSLFFASAGALFYPPLYVPAVIGTGVVYHYFFKEAVEELKKRRLNRYVISTIVLIGAMAGRFFFLMALASWYGSIMRWLLNKTENNSRKSLVNLFGEQPRFVWMVVDGIEVEVPFEKVQSGDQVVVMAGQMIPVDGIISSGMASIDQHQLTGESQPFDAAIGESVFASTVVLSGKITVQVEKTGSETVAAQIGQILNNTADFSLSIKSRVESFLDKVVPSLLVVSAASLPWLGVNGALAVLWSCPGYRMFIFGPMSMLNYLHLSSRQGILIKDGRSLELLNDIDTILFDKTGTLTVEQPIVSQILSCNGLSASELLTVAAAAEYRQSHPIAKAILDAAAERQLKVPKIDHTHYEIGYGIKVNLNHQVIRVGSGRFMEICGISIPAEIKKEEARCHTEGYSLVYVAVDDELGGAIELQPTIRPSTREVIRTLRESGKTLYIISGDHEAPTRRLAQELGIDHYFANTLPENKAALVQQLQEEGRSVCFVGDGINDAIALKQAHLSISLRGATTIATDTAHIVLMDDSLQQLTSIFDLAQEFNGNLNSSFMMTVIPNLICIGGTFLFHWGLATAVIFNICLWFPQLTNVMLPLYKHRETNKPLT